MTVGKGNREQPLSEQQLTHVLREGLESADLAGKRVIVVIPDTTRTAPIPLCFRVLVETLRDAVASLDVLIALGTHPPMREKEIDAHLGIPSDQRAKLGVRVFNHAWDRPEALAGIGTISAGEMERISAGFLIEKVAVEINKLVLAADHILIIGPVFPHEVVGFSGGYKYFFPGISGPTMLHRSHWLGALITNTKINGTKRTPVREMIHRAASFVDIPTTLVALVMRHREVHGLYVGDPIAAWERAADLSAKLNIVWVKHPFHTVLSAAPTMYRDLWTAGKCMYKLEPVVADGGQVIIHAPHVREISVAHGEVIRKVGYHTRDYFLAQWDQFKLVPLAILAHSTHVRGIGTYRKGVERDRIEVILSTGIPRPECLDVNLGYLDPDETRMAEYADLEAEGVLLAPEAGETLYRLADGSVPDIDKL